MPSIDSLTKAVKEDFPYFQFIEDDIFLWSPIQQSIHYRNPCAPEDCFSLLHELAHGLLGHHDFINDVDLLQKEVEAWHHAKHTLGEKYETPIPDSFIEDALDTYRTWLHNRSLCPNCSQNGLQTKNDTYKCINCRCRWRVNDARQCQLKRYKITER